MASGFYHSVCIALLLADIAALLVASKCDHILPMTIGSSILAIIIFGPSQSLPILTSIPRRPH